MVARVIILRAHQHATIVRILQVTAGHHLLNLPVNLIQYLLQRLPLGRLLQLGLFLCCVALKEKCKSLSTRKPLIFS